MTSTTVQNGVSDDCDNSAKTKNHLNGRLSNTNNNGDDGFAMNSAAAFAEMNRKIQINGETELRIDERNISVHINNPFLSDKPSSSSSSTEPDYAEVNKFRPKRPHSIPVSSALNDLQTATSSSSSSVAQSLYNQYRNSPQRLSLLQPNDQSSLYLPPSPLAQSVNENNNILPQLPPKNLSLQQPVVPRRSQSTPRPNHPPLSGTNRDGSPSTIIVNGQIVSQRPRSLDRCASVEKTNGTYNPPPIPLRRLSQPGGIPLNNSSTTPGFSSIRNKNNIVVTPTASVITKQQQQHLHQQPISRGNLPGSNVSTNSGGVGGTNSMRHSITFHGPLNRQSSIGSVGQQQQLQQQKTPTLDNGNVVDHSTLPGKRNDKRPMSYAYGSVPDQAYLENQLRIYSEQLRSITESVRKYSEQAKLLSELKRQQNQQSPMNVVHKPIPMSQSAGNFQTGILSPDPRTSSSSSLPTDAQTPSHQLRMFLENIRSSMRTPDTPVGTVAPPPPPQLEEDHKPVKVPFKPISPAPLTTNNEPKPKTPSDQLRMFLDAIRSNQEPEPLAKSPNLLMTSTKELTLTKQRPKSSTSNENFGHSMSTSESFHQISDNLRIMSQDLEALSPSRNKVASKIQPLNIQTDQTADFYQILDNFHKMADHYKAIGSIEYLKKCSEALMQSTEFLKQQQRLQLQNNGFGTDTDSSSCSTTPGSIREAVQNLLMQPRNGFQIMDDRLSLFIDIMDSQEKFSQVGFFFAFLLSCGSLKC